MRDVACNPRRDGADDQPDQQQATAHDKGLVGEVVDHVVLHLHGAGHHVFDGDHDDEERTALANPFEGPEGLGARMGVAQQAHLAGFG